MGYDANRFEGTIDEDLICSICSDVLADPLQTPCEHVFCSKCIRGWLDHSKTCPEDRINLSESELRPVVRFMRNKLNKLRIRCINVGRGCRVIAVLENIVKHELGCEFKQDKKQTKKKHAEIPKTMEGYLGMSEDEQLAMALQESMKSFEEEKRVGQQKQHNEENPGFKYGGYGMSDAEYARMLQESLCEEHEGHNFMKEANTDNVWGWPSQPKPPAYQRHQHQGFSASGNGISDRMKRETRLVLLGMTGVGKSSTANSIIGREHFKADCDGSSITFKCDHASAKVMGRTVVVVDTPGLFDTRQGNDDTMREITRCVYLSAPGPHALILVVRGGDRQTDQVQKCADIILDVFGEQARRYMIVLFTHRDTLERHRKSLSHFVSTLPEKMKQVLSKCGNRYLAFNNIASSAGERDSQVRKLFTMIDSVVSQNGGRCFTNDVYKDFEKMIVAREKQLKEKLKMQQAEELRIVQARVEKETQRQLQILRDKEREQTRRRQELERQREQEYRRERERERERAKERERERNMWSIKQDEIEKERRENARREREREEQRECERREERQRQARERQELQEREKRIMEEMNRKMDQQAQEQEERYEESVANVRSQVRTEVQKDTGKSGGLITSGVQVVKAIGKGVWSLGKKILGVIW